MRTETDQLIGSQGALVADDLRALRSEVSWLQDLAASRREAWQDEHLDPARIEGRPEYVMQRLEGVKAEFLAAERQATTLSERLREALDDERIERTRPLVQEQEEQAEQREAR